MHLTPQQLKVIRDATRDEASYQRIVALFEEHQNKAQSLPSQANRAIFDFDPEQIALLSSLMNAIPAAVFIKDRDCRFVIANQFTCNSLHIASQDAIVGLSDFDILQNKEIAQFHFEIEQTIMRTGNAVIDYEVYADQDFDTPRWLLSNKAPIYDKDHNIVGLIGINQDITSQKLTEKSLEHERNLLRTIIDHIQDKIYIKDRQSRFQLANNATLQSHGTTSEELKGKTDFDFMDQARAQQFYEQEQTIMDTGQGVINEELLVPADDPQHDPQWYLVSKVPIYDEDGNITGLAGINRNITSRKHAEQNNLDLKLERQRSQILSEFITDSSHEFRTPLSVIQTSTYLMQRVDDEDKQKEYIIKISEQIKRLTNLIDMLLLMARLDHTPEMQPYKLNLKSQLQIVLHRLQTEIDNKQLTVRLIDRESTSIIGDSELLGMAFNALVDNAVSYTPEHGEVMIHIKPEEDYVIVTIQDSGMGMSPEVITQIFNRFYRADEAHSTRGFGLGLPIAKQVIELHGGTIAVESQVGRGSTFIVRLPHHQDP